MTTTVDTKHLCEWALRVMADHTCDHAATKAHGKRDAASHYYAMSNTIWHMLANALRNRAAADTCTAYAERMAAIYLKKGKYTAAGNFNASYKRLLDEGISAMVETFAHETE